MTYHLTGLISTALYLLSVYGLWLQLNKIWQRKLLPVENATAIISLNFTVNQFVAFYAFFLYGFSLERFNHYLVWPRLLAIIFTLALLWELWNDRRNRLSLVALVSVTLVTVVGLLVLLLNRGLAISGVGYSQLLIIGTTLLLVQGNGHQILNIFRSRATGGVELRSHQLTFIKDSGTVLFGFAMGVANGWPLIVMCGVNGCLKLVIMYMFRWVRLVKSDGKVGERRE